MSPREARNVPLDPDWVEFWRLWLDKSHAGGHLFSPRDGAVYQRLPTSLAVEVIACRPDWQGSVGHILTRRCFERLGVPFSVRDSLMSDEEVAKLQADGMRRGNNVFVDAAAMANACPWFKGVMDIFIKMTKDDKTNGDSHET